MDIMEKLVKNLVEETGTLLVSRSEDIGYYGDMSDFGNEVGIVVGQFFKSKEDIEDFIVGLRHGVSLADGTH
jgi:hypothetical protein